MIVAEKWGGREDGALDSKQSLSFFKEGGLKGAHLVAIARERREAPQGRELGQRHRTPTHSASIAFVKSKLFTDCFGFSISVR